MISGILDVGCNSRHDFERTHAVSSTIVPTKTCIGPSCFRDLY